MDYDQLKQAQGSMWGSGPFEEIETNLADMHDAIVAGIGPEAGEPWLDVGCGTGGVSGRAAAAGAKVIGVDLAPALIETAKRRAEEAGLDIKYEVGDAENLRFGDGWFAAVSSSVGVMFAPRQQVAADELARVCAPGGRIAISAWRPRAVSPISSASCGSTSHHLRKESATRSNGDVGKPSKPCSADRSNSNSKNSIHPSSSNRARHSGT